MFPSGRFGYPQRNLCVVQFSGEPAAACTDGEYRHVAVGVASALPAYQGAFRHCAAGGVREAVEPGIKVLRPLVAAFGECFVGLASFI